jgi:hypothetical protein
MTDDSSKPSKNNLKTLLKITAVFALLVAGGYYYWINSPTFAIVELEASIRDKDLATFYSRLDLNKIYDSSIDAIAINEKPEQESPWEILQSNIGSGVTKVLKSQVMNSVKHEIELQFRRDRTQALPLPLEKSAPVSTMREFFNDGESLVFGKLVRSGEMALVNVDVRLKRMAKSYPLTLKLEKDGQWKVSGFEGLASTLTLYEKDKIIRVNEHNLKVQADLKERLVFFGQIRQEESLLGLGQQIHFEFLFHNLSAAKLTDVAGTLNVSDSKGVKVLSEAFSRENLDIVKGQKKVFLINKDSGLFGSKAPVVEGLHLQFDFARVKFDDGQVFQLVKDYNEL